MSDQDRLIAIRNDLFALQKELTASLKGVTDRRRGNIVRQLHEVQSMLDPLNSYASQAGQDRVVDRIFKGKTGGTFVDIGGYDGITGSNTLFFERERDWAGVLLEPMPAQLTRAEAVRKCPCLPYAVADEDGKAQFMAVTQGFTQMSGLVDSYDANLLARVREDQRHVEDMITVETRTMSRVLLDAGIEHPDFVSLDIEGGELSALSGFPFADHQIGVWSIENNNGTTEVGEIMRVNGYALVEFCGPDEIYAHKTLF